MSAATTTSGITLNPGGTLLLASSGGASTDRIGNHVALTLASGTFHTGGLSEGTVNGGVLAQGIGARTLSATSVLDLGAGASAVTFAKSSGMAWTAGTTLKVYDWSGNPAGGGTDALYFGHDATGLTSSPLGQVAFYSDTGTTFLGNGSLRQWRTRPRPRARTGDRRRRVDPRGDRGVLRAAFVAQQPGVNKVEAALRAIGRFPIGKTAPMDRRSSLVPKLYWRTRGTREGSDTARLRLRQNLRFHLARGADRVACARL